jgi:hypothetical protein
MTKNTPFVYERVSKLGVFRDAGFLRRRGLQPSPPQKPGFEEKTGFLHTPYDLGMD